MKNDNETLFEFARTLWLIENASELPSDPAARKEQWHAAKQDYIGKARSITLQLGKRGIHLERENA